MNVHDNTALMLKRMERALREAGGTHTLHDLLHEIEIGAKQSFAYGSTWVITHILDFPRKRVLELFMVIGISSELQILEDQIVIFGKKIGADCIRTQGRRGWKHKATEMGWKHTHNVFIKELR